MPTPLNYTEIVHNIDERLTRMEKMLKALYDLEEFKDEDITFPTLRPEELSKIDAETKQYGQRVPYNLISDPLDVEYFREFIYEAKKKWGQWNDFEQSMLDFADKNFEDVRLSSKHLQALKEIYYKTFNKHWPFKTSPGYMYKYESNPIYWEFFTKDKR